MNLNGVAEAIGSGGLAGVVAALLWVVWDQGKSHAANLAAITKDTLTNMVPRSVYDGQCQRSDRQAELMGDMAKSLAVLVDRREAAR